MKTTIYSKESLTNVFYIYSTTYTLKKAIFERIGTAEPIGFVIDIDRNTKPRETQGLSVKLKISSGVIDMQEAIESQESFTKPNPY